MNKKIEIIEKIRTILEETKYMSFDEKVELYNAVSDMIADMIDLPHPAIRTKLVRVENVRGNDYNPNRVAPPEMKLLKFSIRKDGITMPVVVADDTANPEEKIVVDGFHRTTIVKTESDIRESLRGYLPVVTLNKSIEDRMTSTVRHNLARGSHMVELTARLVTALKKHYWTDEKIGQELGMDPDEVLRLKQVTGLAEAFADKEFSQAWEWEEDDLKT